MKRMETYLEQKEQEAGLEVDHDNTFEWDLGEIEGETEDFTVVLVTSNYY